MPKGHLSRFLFDAIASPTDISQKIATLSPPLRESKKGWHGKARICEERGRDTIMLAADALVTLISPPPLSPFTTDGK